MPARAPVALLAIMVVLLVSLSPRFFSTGALPPYYRAAALPWPLDCHQAVTVQSYFSLAGRGLPVLRDRQTLPGGHSLTIIRCRPSPRRFRATVSGRAGVH